MSGCPHLTSACNAEDRRELAACPGANPKVLLSLSEVYPLELASNPVLPMLALENPPLWAPIAINVRYKAAKSAWLNSLYNIDVRALQRFGLEATEHLWWMRKGSKNEKALALLVTTRALLDNPRSHAVIERFANVRREAFNYLRATLRNLPSGMVMRALYFFSGSNSGEHRHALGILTDAVQLAHQKKHGFIGATELALAEVQWQREKWEAQ